MDNNTLKDKTIDNGSDTCTNFDWKGENLSFITATLELFGCVPYVGDEFVVKNDEVLPKTSLELLEYGVVLTPEASVYAHPIKIYLKEKYLKQEDFNKTFYETWDDVRSSSELKLYLDKIAHYLTTYGFEELGIYSESYVYVPNKKFGISSKKKSKNIPIRVIGTLTYNEIINKCLSLLESGIALQEETLKNIFESLRGSGFTPSGDENIKNREAAILMIHKFGIFPNNGEDIVRYLVYNSVRTTLLVKNEKLTNSIILSKYKLPRLSDQDCQILGESFNRYKPIWMAFKRASTSNSHIVNRISKFSKNYHKPLPKDVIGSLTTNYYSEDVIRGALNGANVYRIARALGSVRDIIAMRKNSSYDRVFFIRNNKMYAQDFSSDSNLITRNIDYYVNLEKILEDELIQRLSHLKNKKVIIPNNVEYAFPVSEKAYCGNFPKGTKFIFDETHDAYAVGIYWENNYGAKDLDLSSVNSERNTKIGWNSQYKTDANDLMYSGDIRHAESGAVELIYADGQSTNINNNLLMVNIYRGEVGSKYKLLVGYSPKIGNVKTGSMIDKGDIIVEEYSTLVQKQHVLGIFTTDDKSDSLAFYLVDRGLGNVEISDSSSKYLKSATNALSRKCKSGVFIREILEKVGANIITNKNEIRDHENDYIDLNINSLSKDTFSQLVDKYHTR